MNLYCQKHSGRKNEYRRRPYDSIMRALPRNQSGSGRARKACAICAYEQGWEDARRAIGERRDALIESLPHFCDEHVFTSEQRCLLNLSANIWRRRGAAKRFGLGFNEETATEVFLLDLEEQFPGTVTISPFNRGEERRIGADWAWTFVSADGQWSQSMLVQAKRLDDREREYPKLFYRSRATGSQPSILQLDQLIDNAKRFGFPPVYALYNHLSDTRRVPRGACGLLRSISCSLPESWGIAVASAFEVRNSKPDKSYDCHRDHSVPLHCLLCPKGSGDHGAMGSAGVAAAGLSRLFEGTVGEDVAGPELTPPFRPRRGLPEIFRYAEQLHRSRMERAEASVVEPESEFPGIGGVVILRGRDEKEDLVPSEHPGE